MEKPIVPTDLTDKAPSSNLTAKAFTLTSALWFAAATSFGMIAAGYLIAPDFRLCDARSAGSSLLLFPPLVAH